MMLEDWQQTVDLFSLYWDYESQRTVGVSHLHVTTVSSFVGNGSLDLFFWILQGNVLHHEHNFY